ncbi:MAG: ABC transporter permease [Phycisphaerae bacterium]|nr:ABC transporter permease [Phycisphaerae bacterium]
MADTRVMTSTRAHGLYVYRELADMFRYWDVFSSLVMRDFKARYRAKVLGIFWSIGDPLIMMFVYTLVFMYMFERAIYAYPVLLLLGMCPHRYFANGVMGATDSMLNYSPLVKRVAFPRHLLPLAVLLSHLIHFFIELGLVAVVSRFYPGSLVFSRQVLWLPVVFAVQFAYMMGLAFLCSTLNVFYRDTQYMLRSSMLVLYWLTPIFYPAQFFLGKSFEPFFWFNPMAGVVIGYRRILMEALPPNWTFLAVGAAVSAVFLIIGISAFRRYEGTFADYV